MVIYLSSGERVHGRKDQWEERKRDTTKDDTKCNRSTTSMNETTPKETNQKELVQPMHETIPKTTLR